MFAAAVSCDDLDRLKQVYHILHFSPWFLLLFSGHVLLCTSTATCVSTQSAGVVCKGSSHPGLCLSPGDGGPQRILLCEEWRMAPGQEQGAAGMGVLQGHSFQWQSQPEVLMGLLCRLMQSFPVLNLVKEVMPDITVW